MLAQRREGNVTNTYDTEKTFTPRTVDQHSVKLKYKSLRIGLFDDSRVAMLLQKSLLKEVFGNTTKICLSSHSKTIKLWIQKRLIDILIMDVVQMGTEYPLDVINKAYYAYCQKYGTDEGFPKLIFNSSSPRWVVEDVIRNRYQFLEHIAWRFIQKPAKRSDLFSCILDLIGNPEQFFKSNEQVNIMQNLARAIESDNIGSSLLEGLRLAVKNVFSG